MKRDHDNTMMYNKTKKDHDKIMIDKIVADTGLSEFSLTVFASMISKELKLNKMYRVMCPNENIISLSRERIRSLYPQTDNDDNAFSSSNSTTTIQNNNNKKKKKRARRKKGNESTKEEQLLQLNNNSNDTEEGDMNVECD